MIIHWIEDMPEGLTTDTADVIVRMAVGVLTTGVSRTKGRLGVHLLESATGNDLIKIEQAVAAYGSLVVTTSKNAIASDGVDEAVITCNDVRVQADPNVNYRVLLGHGVYAKGVAAVAGGVVTLEFSTETPGIYQIEILRSQGTYIAGYVTIEAAE